MELPDFRKQPLLHLLPLLLLLVTSRAPVCGARTVSEAQVQCTAKCLLDYREELSENDANFIRKNPELVMLQCTKNSSVNSANCLQCIDVCSKVQKIVNTKNCNSFCKTGSPRCRSACKFVVQVLGSNPGVCPPPNSKLQTEGLQVRCTSDSHCFRADTKCCPIRGLDRRSYCVHADFNKDMPPMAPVPRVRKVVRLKGKRRRKELAFSLDWHHYDVVGLKHPVVFIVQIRTFRGYDFDPNAVTEWVDLIMTCRRSAMLEDLEVGTWYQFRLAATSAEGMRGYSAASSQARLTREPKRPSPPRELTEGTARIHGSLVDVEISWSGPRRTQARIDSYEVTWAKHYGYVTGETQTAAKYKVSVPSSQNTYSLADLKPGTTYKVEVISVSKFGKTELRSLPASIFVTTISIPSPASSPPDTSDSFTHLVRSSKCLCSPSGKVRSDAIVTKTPYFEKSSLKMAVLWNHPRPGEIEFTSSSSEKTGQQSDSVTSYLIEWAPKVCVETAWQGAVNKPSYKPFTASVHGSLIHYLTDLQFNCHYILRVLGVSSSGAVKPLWDTCFCTPSCFEVKVKRGFDPPKCGTMSGYIPNAPTNLQYEMEHDEGSNKYSVRLIWNSFSGPEIDEVHSYRVLWGPRLREPIDVDLYGRGITPLLDMTKAESKVVAGRHRSLILSNLNESTVYIAHVQSVSTHGESAAASIFFTTPGRRKAKPRVKTVMYHIGVHSTASYTTTPGLSFVFTATFLLLLRYTGR